MKPLHDIIVLRLPPGKSVRDFGGPTLQSRGHRLAKEFASTPPISPSEIRVERIEATNDDLLKLEAEKETVASALNIRFDHVQPVALPANDASGPDGEDGMAWGLGAIGAGADEEYTGRDVTVAVLDTGIDATHTTHPAFRSLNVVARNFTNSNPDDWQDTNGHGTHCTGTIVGQDVDGVRIGVARGVKKVLAGKVLGASGGSTGSIYQGILWAVQEGAHIISMSLAINFDNIRQRLIDNNGLSPPEATSLTLKGFRENFVLFDRLAALFQAPGDLVRTPVVVVATGNDSHRSDFTIEASPPAVAQWFLSVNAIGRDEAVASFSNTNGKISAPGIGILSAALGGGVRRDSGTSMAAPHVAGAAAQWIEKLRVDGAPISARDVQLAILRHARAIDGDKADIGAGLIQLPVRE